MRAAFWGFAIVCAMAAAASPLSAEEASNTGAVGVQPASYISPSYTAPSKRLDPEIALQKINAFRAASGLPALVLDPALTQAASAHAADLAARDAISHYGADGSTPVTRVASTGYDAIVTGENVATGQRHFDEVLDGWIDSESHRKTLLAPTVIHAGLALVYNPKASSRTFWTMVVAEPF